MGTVLNAPGPPALRARPQVVIAGVVAAVVAGALLLWLIQRLDPSPSFVDRLTIENPTPYQLEVSVTGSGRDVTVDLGAVAREQTKTFEEVLDQGDEWVIRFQTADYDGGDMRLSKDDLESRDWKVTVPGSVADRLAAAGAAPWAKPAEGAPPVPAESTPQ